MTATTVIPIDSDSTSTPAEAAILQTPPRICILGGGFGGLYTALRLDQLPWDLSAKPEITLIDQNDRFVFLPLLYELLTNEMATWEVAPPFAELLANTRIRFQQGKVMGIDLEKRQVKLEAGTVFSWDRIVLALGGETPLDLVPGAATHAIPFRTVQDAYRLQARLRALETSDRDKIRIAIVGAGYSGVELACKLADRLGARGRIRIVERNDMILRDAPEFNRKSALQALSAREIWLDLETTVTEIGLEQISLQALEKTDTLPVDVVLWTVGTRVVPVIHALPFKQSKQNRLQIEPTLQVSDYPDIFALGDLVDCKDAKGQRVPTTAQAAFQQADYVGWNIWASLSDRPLLPFNYQNLGEMMALGVDSATLAGLGLSLNGPFAYVFRRLIYLYRMPTLDHQLRVGFNWLTRPLQDLLSQ